MHESLFFAAEEADTAALARHLAARARAGDVLLLAGPLGAGKTAFARAFVRALADDPQLEVPSPTFTLLQTYETAGGTVFHYDLWRLADHHGLAELGWDEAERGIVLVEWPDRLGALTPAGALAISISPCPGGGTSPCPGGGISPCPGGGILPCPGGGISPCPGGREIKLHGESRWFDGWS